MVLEHGSSRYEVGKPVAEAGNYRLYLCIQEDTERQCLLQIASELGHNGSLDLNAYILAELKRKAEALELEYQQAIKDPSRGLNYNLSFPELVDSFVCESQGGRRVNILAFNNVAEVSQMVPLRNIVVRDRRRVDLRTSAWIMGKTLKLLTFTHSEGLAVQRVDDTNILIEPRQHYVVLFDCSQTKVFPEGIPAELQQAEIAQAAQAVVALLGGDRQTKTIPDDGPEFVQYSDFLFALAEGVEGNAARVHKEFYQIVDGIWQRAFYPFTSLPVNT